MYSMVLMAALATSPDAASFGRGGGCYGGCTGTVVSVGCTGCTGAVVPLGGCCSGSCFGSCFGSSCCGGSCYSSGCCGGRGGLFGGGLFGLRARLFGGGGCCGGSCYSSGCCGGSCYSSCCGGSCFSSSCFGSCTGMADFGYGGGFPMVNPNMPTTACYGSPILYNRTGTLSGPTVYGWPVYSPTSFGYGSCFGSGPVYYGPDFHQGGSFAPMYPPIQGSGILKDGLGSTGGVPSISIDNTKEFRAAEGKPSAAPARLTVELPAAAKLYVDGSLVNGDTTTRNFHTPDLTPGKTFYYDLKAEVTVGGKTVTEEKRVLVKAGDTLTEAFPKLIAAASSDKTDAIAKK
jgi:uncharacterized protein (TIGR03000 family)